MDSQRQIAPLTGLRAVAALYVFFFHIQIRWPFVPTKFLANLVEQGAVGMSIFFVLSGFILTHQYAGPRFDLRRYAINRFARIYPVYALCALLSIGWIGIPWGGWQNIARMVILVASNILLVQAWFPPFFGYWNDGGSWSISVEAFLYFMLPLMLPWLARQSRKNLAIIVSVAYVASILPGMVFNLWQDTLFTVTYAMPIFRLPEFVIGVCACLMLRGARPSSKVVIAATALMLCAVSDLGIVGYKFSGYTIHNWIVDPAVVLVIISLTVRNIASRIMGSRPVVWLGEISYCIYSLQPFIIRPLLHDHKKLVKHFPIFAHDSVLFVTALMILVVSSGLCHHLVERPTRDFIRKRFSARHATVTAGEGSVVEMPLITDFAT